MAFVTIGLPFYNAEKTLADAIRSVFAQTHQDWELILVDDGSTDRSLEIARSVNDPRVRVISDGKNLKLAARLNQIVREAKYDFIARMDADDLMSPTRIEEELKVFKECPDIDLVSTGVYSLDDNDQLVGVRWPSFVEPTPKDIERENFEIVHAALLGKTQWFRENPYDETFPITQDAELWARTASEGHLHYRLIQKPMYYYREGNSCVSFKKTMRSYKCGLRILFRYGKKLNGSNIKYYIALLRYCAKIAVVGSMFTLGLASLRQKRRNLNWNITKELSNQFNQELKDIKTVDLSNKLF